LRTAKLIYLALGGAALALLVGVGFFFAPFGGNQSVANRGTAAAALVSGFAVVLTALTLVTTVRVESSDFRAAERVKEDITRLLATCRSIYLKAAWLTQQKDQQDVRHASLFDSERQVIQDFLNSTTAPAFYALEGRKTAAARSAREEWRVFSWYMVDILRAEMPGQYQIIANRAVRVERLITQLRADDITALSDDVSSLPRAINEFADHRSEALLAGMAYKSFGGEEPSPVSARGMELLRALKRQGVDDPDIEFFLAIEEDSIEHAKQALAAGADARSTINEILSRYPDKLPADLKPPATKDL
jgi:hypothetical protein